MRGSGRSAASQVAAGQPWGFVSVARLWSAGEADAVLHGWSAAVQRAFSGLVLRCRGDLALGAVGSVRVWQD